MDFLAGKSEPILGINWVRLIGYDFFVSFKLGAYPIGAQSYASDLARCLREKDFSVFFSEEEAPPGTQLDDTIKSALRRSRILIVVANKGALCHSTWVREEVEFFRREHPGRPVIPIDVDGAIKCFGAQVDAAAWLLGGGDPIRVDETDEALRTGIIGLDVLRKLVITPRFVKGYTRLRWSIAAIGALLIGLSAFALAKASDATREATIASAERDRAIVQEKIAKSEKGRAELEKTRANKEATAAGRNAQEARKQAAIARTERDNAQEQSARGLSQLLASQSRTLYGKNDQRALLLADEAVKATAHQRYVTPSARSVLNQGLSRITGVGLSGHRDSAVLAEFSDNEHTLATGASDGEVRIWNVQNPNEPRSKQILRLQKEPKAVLFDQTGSNAVTLSRTGDSRSNTQVWSLRNGGRYPSPHPLLEPDSQNDAIAASRDVIAVAGSSGKITLISRADLTHTKALRVLRAPRENDIVKLTFSNDGNILLAGTQSSHVWIWDLTNPQPTPTAEIFANHEVPLPVTRPARVDILGISDDHSTLFTASSEWFDNSGWADLDLKLWRLHALKPVGSPILLPHRVASNGSAIQSARFSRSGSDLITVSLDGRVRSWRIAGLHGGEIPSGSFVSGGFVQSSDISPDGGLLSLAVGNEVHVVNTSDVINSNKAPSVVSLSGFDGRVRFVRYSASGRYLVAGGLGGSVRLWDLLHEDPSSYVPSTRPSPYAPARSVILSKNGMYAVILRSSALEFWDLRNPFLPTIGRTLPVDAARLEQIGNCFSCTVIVSPNQRWAAIQSADKNQAEISELTTNGRSFRINARIWSVTKEVEFSPDGRWLLVKEEHGIETIYDLETSAPTIPTRTLVKLPKGSYSRKLSPDSRYLVYLLFVNEYNDQIGRDRKVGVLTPFAAINDISLRREIDGFATGIGNTVFSDDGRWLALAGKSSLKDSSKDDTVVKLMRVDDPRVPAFVLNGQEFAAKPQFSRDGNWLLTGSNDMLLRGARTHARLWRLNNGGRSPTAQILPSVDTYLHAEQLSPDGRFLVTISGAGPTARLWRLTDKVALAATLAVPKPVHNWYYKIVFSEDGKTLVIAGHDSPIPYLWRLNGGGISSRGIPIPNGDREIKSIDFTRGGDSLIILNSGGTTDGISGTAGAHVTVVELNKFPAEGSTYAIELSEATHRVTYRRDIDLLLTQGNSLRGQVVSIADMIQRAESTVGRNLTFDEWVKSGTTETYRPTFSHFPVDAKTLKELPSIIERLRKDSPKDAKQLTNNLINWIEQLNEADVCSEIAWDFAQQGDGHAALASISCALEHFPNNAEYRDTRGVAFTLLGRRNEAIADFDYYIRQHAGNPIYAEHIYLRQQWIRALKARTAPFSTVAK